jgi:glycerate kinase
MRILIAPNAFKHSLSAAEASLEIERGLKSSAFRGSCTQCPVGDGGDGTAELLLRQCGGEVIAVTAHDPLGRPMIAHFGLIDAGRTALIDLADTSGLRLLSANELNPLRTTTFGTGEVMRQALDHGVQEFIVGVGGSATVDGGVGLLRALGARFLDARGQAFDALPESLEQLAAIDLSGLDRRLAGCRMTILCDVANPLLGPEGAASVYGPQKGATPDAVRWLEEGLTQLRRVALGETGRDMGDLPRGGAAGGVAAGLWGMLGADLVNGIDDFLRRVEFDRALHGVDVVITGEGRIDDQTAHGKGPWGVAQRARAQGAFVIGLAGEVPLAPSPTLRAGFDVLLAIGHRVMSTPEAIACTAENLRRTACDIGNFLAFGGNRGRDA